MNAGVILYSQQHRYLCARIELDARPGCSRSTLARTSTRCAGGLRAFSKAGTEGPLAGAARLGERFRWLTAPRSTGWSSRGPCTVASPQILPPNSLICSLRWCSREPYAGRPAARPGRVS